MLLSLRYGHHFWGSERLFAGENGAQRALKQPALWEILALVDDCTCCLFFYLIYFFIAQTYQLRRRGKKKPPADVNSALAVADINRSCMDSICISPSACDDRHSSVHAFFALLWLIFSLMPVQCHDSHIDPDKRLK